MNDISLENLSTVLKHNFDSEFDSWASRSSDLSKIDTDSIHKALSDIKNKELNYNADNVDYQKQLSDAVNYISELKGKYDDAVMMKDEIVQINNTPELNGNNWNNLKISKAGQDLAGIIGGKTTAKIKDGTLGYDIDGIFMSTFDIRKMINNSTLDTRSKCELDNMVQYYRTQAQRQGAGDLNISEVRSMVESEIVNKGNIHSLKNDKIISGRETNFMQEFINNLQSMSRKNLGIGQDIKGGPSNDRLSLEEATIIASEMQKDSGLEQEQLIDFFTAHVFEQYENERRQNPRANYMNNLQSQQEVLAQATKYEKGSL